MEKKFLVFTGLLLVLIVVFGFKSTENTVKVISIGVIVSDLDKSFDFYTKVIGMEHMSDYHQSSEMSTKYQVNSGKEFNIIGLKLVCDGYTIRYKLNKTVDNQPEQPFHNENNYYGFEKIGSSYFSIDVNDVDPYIARLEANKIKHKVARLPNDYIVVLVHDPDGVLLEIRGY